MKARVDRAELAQAVDWLRGFTAGSGVHLPALHGLHIAAADGVLVLRASNLESTAEAVVPAAIDEPGVVLPSGGLLAALVAKLPSSAVSIAADDGALAVESGSVSARVPLLVESDFPPAMREEDDHAITIPSMTLEQVARRVAPAVYAEGGRPALTAVHLIVGGGKLVAAATDDRRLHRLSVDLPTEVEIDVLMPAGVFAPLGKLDRPVTLSVTDGRAVFSTDDRQLVTSLVAGEQPDPGQFFQNASSDGLVAVERDALLETLNRVVSLTRTGKNLFASMIASDGSLHVTATDGGSGSIADALPCEGDGSTHINPELLAQALDALGTERAELALDPRRAIGVRAPGGSSFDAVVMPVNQKSRR